MNETNVLIYKLGILYIIYRLEWRSIEIGDDHLHITVSKIIEFMFVE